MYLVFIVNKVKTCLHGIVKYKYGEEEGQEVNKKEDGLTMVSTTYTGKKKAEGS